MKCPICLTNPVTEKSCPRCMQLFCYTCYEMYCVIPEPEFKNGLVITNPDYPNKRLSLSKAISPGYIYQYDDHTVCGDCQNNGFSRRSLLDERLADNYDFKGKYL